MNKHISATGVSLDAILGQVEGVARQVAPGAAARDAGRKLLFDEFALVRAAGIPLLRVPVDYGGAGGSARQFFDALITLSAADSNLGHSLRSHFNLVETLRLSGDEETKKLHFGRIAAGAIYGGAHTEAGTSRPGVIQTRLTRRDGGYRLDGLKHYSTGTLYADYASITALDDEGGIVGVTIPVNRAGVQIVDDWKGIGQKLTASGTIRLSDVEVFPDELSRRHPDDLAGRYSASFRQLHLAAAVAGAARRLLDDAVAFTNDHSRSPAISKAEKSRDDEFIQLAVGEIGANAFAARATILEAADSLDLASGAIAGHRDDASEVLLQATIAVAQAQLVGGSLALRSANLIFDAGGGSAASTDFNLDRHWRNIRTVLNHNPLLHKTRVLGDYYLTGETHHLTEGKSI